MELSEKELNVIRLMAEGVKKAEIAKELKISKRTVEAYHEKIRAKMGVKSLYEALYKFGYEVAKKQRPY